MSATNKIEVARITFHYCEGPHKLAGVTVNSFSDADILLRRAAYHASEQGYDKVDFTIEWKDGSTYKGRFDLERHHTDVPDLLGAHVRDHCSFGSGRHKPDWMTDVMYQSVLAQLYTPEMREYLARMLDEYELG